MDRISFGDTPGLLPLGTQGCSRMSIVRQAIIGIAILFFTAVCAVYLPSSRRAGPYYQTNQPLIQQEDIEAIRERLLNLSVSVPADLTAEYFHFVGVVVNAAAPSFQDIKNAKAFIKKVNGRWTEERKAQDREYEEVYKRDKARLEKREKMADLQSRLSDATENLKARLKALEPLEACWKKIDGLISGQYQSFKSYQELFKDYESKENVPEEIDLQVPEDHFLSEVQEFCEEVADDKLAEIREKLENSYRDYAEQIQLLKKRFAWVRLKNYHAKVGEKFFSSQVRKEGFLGEVLSSEALLRS